MDFEKIDKYEELKLVAGGVSGILIELGISNNTLGGHHFNEGIYLLGMKLQAAVDAINEQG